MKVYIVIEYGGGWEDSWERISGVCSSLELAEKLTAKINQAHSGPESISRNKYEELCNAVGDYEYEHNITLGNTMSEAIPKLFPEYNKKDIAKATAAYDSYDEWRGVKIKRKNLIENESELTSNKWKLI